jgi:hypothetical protein
MNRRSAQSLAAHQIAAATAVFSAVMFSAIPARSQGAIFIDGSAATALLGGPFAGGGAVGMLLSPRYDLRLEVEVARWRAERVSERSSHGSFDFTNGSRPVSYSILLGRHLQPRRRAQLQMLVGAGIIRHSWTDSGHQDFRFNGIVTQEFNWNDRGTTTDLHLTAGLEATLSLTQHLAVVPRWRGQLYSASAEGSSGVYYLPTTTIRNLAGIAFRWRF